MCHEFLSDPRFPRLLVDIDRDLAQQVRDKGCSCGGRLHAAHYPRKPRGGPEGPDPEFSRRLSFCCDADGCRSRATPPSVRFLGPKVYLGVLVVLITALRQGPTPKAFAELKAHFGVDRRTIARWQEWWQETFKPSRFWRAARARFASLPEPTVLPRALLRRFRARSAKHMARLLKFLSPISASRRLQVQAF